MEFDTLRSFLTLAEQANFGWAALRLHLGQLALTKQIHWLEEPSTWLHSL